MGSRSHLIVWKPLILRLADNGHAVTVVAPEQDTQLKARVDRFIHVYNNWHDDIVDSTSVFRGNIPADPSAFLQSLLKVQETAVANPDLRQMIDDEHERFDVVVLSPLCLDLGLYLAKHRFQASIVLYSMPQRWTVFDLAMGNPINPSYMPNEVFSAFSQQMSFLERVVNTLIVGATIANNDWYVMPSVEDKIKDLLSLASKPDLKSILYEDVAFALFNNHPFFESVVPTNPNTAHVGGAHLTDKTNQLPDNIRQWLDGAESVIFISFGSILDCSKMPLEHVEAFLIAFRSLPSGIRVLWKWDSDKAMANKPESVLLSKWLPQQDILSEKKVKLFISHGGLMSTQEAVYHAVPTLFIPAFGDQFSNAERVSRLGLGKVLSWTDLDSRKLTESIKGLLCNAEIEANAMKASEIFRDNLIDPLEAAAFHIEYVIRHKGARHLESPAKRLAWYEYYLIDVFAFIAVGLVTILYMVAKLLQWCFISKRQKSKQH